MQEAKDAPPKDVQIDLKGIRVLVVDDHPSNRLLLKTLLTAWGCCCEEAEDGRNALIMLYKARCRREPFQVALLDMAMPEMDGEDLATQIKADPELKETLLIMITSLGLRGDAARLRRLGFDGYIAKPVRQSHLRDCLALVLGRAGQSEQIKPGSLVTRHTLSESHRAQVRILVAEDNPTNQLVTLGILKNMGYRADAVANGVEAVLSLQKIPYDLVLMDCQMPEMDGYEATRRIRASDSKVLNSHIPIIAMTAYALKGDREKCLEAGMNDYLSKPVQPKKVAEVLEHWLIKRDQEERPESQSLAVQTKEALLEEETKAVFDKEELMERLNGDKELFLKILPGFIEDITSRITRLRELFDQGNAAGIRQQAHTIKGAASNVAAGILKEVAWEMEKTMEEGRLEQTPGMIARLEEEFERFRKILMQKELGLTDPQYFG
jgi:CheY-like chemotaxis protein/HPt (histidine-containing phosphotransfer) domain-containing protein